MNINKQELIRLKSKTQIEFDDFGKYTFSANDVQLIKGISVLKVLQVFSAWKTIEKGVEELGKLSADKDEYLKVTSDFYEMLQKDFFEIKDSQKNTFGFHDALFDSFPVHLRMLNDRARTTGFAEAIRQTVTADDIVLDIGTGSGVLAVTAAMAGAKHVYAVEKTGFTEVAETICKQNGVWDKITLLKGHSTDIVLPQKATVLVSEIIGNDPFDEDIIRTFNDAKTRLLCEGARIIPQSITVFAIAAECNRNVYNNNNLSEENFENWQKWYGIDFTAFQKFHQNNPPKKINIHSKNSSVWKPLSDAVKLYKEDLTLINTTTPQSENIFSTDKEGLLNAVVLFFETALTSGITLSVHPEKAAAGNHWLSQLFFLPPRKVQKGEKHKIKYTVKELRSQVQIESIQDI